MSPAAVTRIGFDKARARASEKEALRRASAATGVSLERIAVALAEEPYLVRVWASPARTDVSMPSWALRRLRDVLPEVAEAIDALLEGDAAHDEGLSDAAVLRACRAHAECSAALASPARHTAQGARVLLAAWARVSAEHARLAGTVAATVASEQRRAA